MGRDDLRVGRTEEYQRTHLRRAARWPVAGTQPHERTASTNGRNLAATKGPNLFFADATNFSYRAMPDAS